VGSGSGYTKTLQLVGTGYRAEVRGQILNLMLGFSHPINFPIPQGIKVEIPGDSKGTLLIMTGADKERMGETAAKIRGFRGQVFLFRGFSARRRGLWRRMCRERRDRQGNAGIE